MSPWRSFAFTVVFEIALFFSAFTDALTFEAKAQQARPSVPSAIVQPKTHIPLGRVENVDEWLRFSSDSYKKFTGKALLEETVGVDSLADLHVSEHYAVLSHGIQDDPIYNYFNKGALLTFEYPEEEIYKLPSRYSAPDGEIRKDRSGLIRASVEKGFTVYTSAVRRTKTGKLFKINDGRLWNVYNTNGERVGQTAFFDRRKIPPVSE